MRRLAEVLRSADGETGVKRLHAVGLLAALLAIAGAWFVSTHEEVETRQWVGPSSAARANPYLAAMRFAERLGMTASIAYGAARLDSMTSRGVVLLPAGRSGLSASRARMLDRWIQSGGHAIVEPEPHGEIDPVLDQYGIKREESARLPKVSTIEIEVPGAAKPLVAARLYSPVIRFERGSPDIAPPDKAGAWLGSLPIGAGRLTVVSGMERFKNRSIGSHDHAELLRRVLAFQPSARELLIVRLPSESPLWGWLRDHALPTLTAAVILLTLWLARTLPRFGPVQPEPPLQRRQLREHILATGRFRWTQGGRAGLLEAAREVCQRHVANAHPRLAQLPPERRWPELAARTGLDAAAIAAAFGGQARNAREFVHIVRTLASIHSTISRPSDASSTRPHKS